MGCPWALALNHTALSPSRGFVGKRGGVSEKLLFRGRWAPTRIADLVLEAATPSVSGTTTMQVTSRSGCLMPATAPRQARPHTQLTAIIPWEVAWEVVLEVERGASPEGRDVLLRLCLG